MSLQNMTQTDQLNYWDLGNIEKISKLRLKDTKVEITKKGNKNYTMHEETKRVEKENNLGVLTEKKNKQEQDI